MSLNTRGVDAQARRGAAFDALRSAAQEHEPEDVCDALRAMLSLYHAGFRPVSPERVKPTTEANDGH